MAELYKQLEKFKGLQNESDKLWWQGYRSGVYMVNVAYKLMNLSNHHIANWPWKHT